MNTATPIRPSAWYYLVAVPPFLAGAGLFIYALLHVLAHVTDSLTQIVVPGDAELILKHGQTYTIFLERQSVVNGKIYSTEESLNGLQCKVNELSGEATIPIRQASMSTTYNLRGRSGRSVLEFHVPADGPYKFACNYGEGRQGPEAVMAVGSGVGERIFGTVFQSFAAIFGGAGSAGIVFLLVLMLRERAKKRLASTLPMHS